MTDTPYNPSNLTWAALLAQWIEFAQSALALPDTPEGQAMRDSVPDIIHLQAIFMSLNEIDTLPISEQALGVDRSGYLFDQAVKNLQRHHQSTQIPELITELINDTESAIVTHRKRIRDLID